MEHKKRYLFSLLLLSALSVVCVAVTSLPVRSTYSRTASENVSVDGELIGLDLEEEQAQEAFQKSPVILEVKADGEETIPVGIDTPDTESSNQEDSENLEEKADAHPTIEINNPISVEIEVPSIKDGKSKRDRVIPGAEIAAEKSAADEHRSDTAKEHGGTNSNGASTRVLGLSNSRINWKSILLNLVSDFLNKL